MYVMLSIMWTQDTDLITACIIQMSRWCRQTAPLWGLSDVSVWCLPHVWMHRCGTCFFFFFFCSDSLKWTCEKATIAFERIGDFLPGQESQRELRNSLFFAIADVRFTLFNEWFSKLSQVSQTDLLLLWSTDRCQLTTPTDVHLLWRCDSTTAVAAQTATRSPLLLLLITTMATSVSAGQWVTLCRMPGALAYAVKRFESLASPQRLTVFSLSSL